MLNEVELSRLVRFELAYNYDCIFPESIPPRAYVEPHGRKFPFYTFSASSKPTRDWEDLIVSVMNDIHQFLGEVGRNNFKKVLVRTIDFYEDDVRRGVSVRLTPNVVILESILEKGLFKREGEGGRNLDK